MSDVTEELTRVALELKAAKLQEALAKERRIEYEEKLIALVPPELEVHKGQTTISFPDGSKVVTKAGVTVKANIAEIQKIFEDLPEHHAPIANKTTHALDLVGYEWYRMNFPDIYNLIAEHVEVTPKKIGVELKPAKK
jgi:hypothetical protein